MKDPHVVSLEYKLETDDTLKFDNPEPRGYDAASFTVRLSDGVLTATMKDHFATQEEAVEVVRPFLIAWELHHALEHGRREFRFKFMRSNIIDRKPTPGALDDVVLTSTGLVAAAGFAPTLTVTRRHYPEPPPPDFVASPNVETLWDRYENYLLGREYLPAMGYFCLSVVETLYGPTPSSGKAPPRKTSQKRTRTATALNIEVAVFEKLGELTTERGDATMARKQEQGKPFRPLSGHEAAWVQAALRAITRRVAVKAAGVALPSRLSMRDLPQL
jgi:hypothetical protein